MADGALSWLAMVAARMLAEGAAPARGELELAGGLACYRPYACADGHVTLGALEPKFWQAFCRGVGREDLVERHLDPSGGETQRELEAIFAARTRAEWTAFAGEHDCCLEPVLGLDEALDSELVRAREMVVEIDQPGAERPVRLLGVPVKLSRTPGDPARAPGPALGQDTRAVLEGLGYAAGADRAAAGVGRGRGTRRGLRARLVHGLSVRRRWRLTRKYAPVPSAITPTRMIGSSGGPTGSGRSTAGSGALMITRAVLGRRGAEAVADRVGELAGAREGHGRRVAARLLGGARRDTSW